jgi:hypothetical protein
VLLNQVINTMNSVVTLKTARHKLCLILKHNSMGKSSKKFWMWTSGTIIFLVIGSIVGWFIIKNDLSKPNSSVDKKIGQLFTDMIIDASDSLYKVSYSKFDIDLKSGKGVINDLKLIPDSAVLERLTRTNRAPNNVMDVRIKSLLINNLRFIKEKQGRKLGIQSIIIQEPTIKVTNKLLTTHVQSGKEKHSKLFSLLQTLLKLCEVKSFTMRKMDFSYVNNNGTKPKRTALKNLNVNISGITAVETNQNGVRSTVIRVLKNRVATPDSLYYLTIKDFRFLPEQGQAVVKLAELQPRLSRAAYFQSVKWAKDRIHIIYRDLVLRHINLQQLLEKQQVHIGLMESSAAYAEVYTNYNWPRRVPPVRHNPFPHQQFMGLAFDITIDTMRMRNSDTHWRVLAAHSDHVSSLDFVKSNGTILNITNNKEQIIKTPYTKLTINCLLNNAAPLHLNMNFNLKDTNGAFTARSTMGKMDARVLNGFSEPFSMTSIKDGNINKMELELKANDAGAAGNVNLYYTGIKVALLKQDKKTKELKQRKLISVLSNAMLPNDNPAKNGKFKKGPINVKRDVNQSFFGFLSKCMLDGMTSAMTGLEQAKKKKDNNILIKVGRAVLGNPTRKKIK